MLPASPVSLPPSTTAPPVTAKLTFSAGTSPSDNITSNDALSGTGLANTVVYFTIDGTPTASTVMTDAKGAWSFTPSGLADGVHTIVASQTDTFGNTGTASLSFTLDTTAPERRHAEPGCGVLEHRQHYGGDGADFYRGVGSFSSRRG